MAEATEKRPIILSVNCIHDGQFYRAGVALPFENENALPESLKAFIATGNETSFDPAERDIYADLPRNTRRQVRRLEMQAAHQEFAEQVAAEPLREDVQAVLEAEHDIAIGRAKAQAQFNQDAVDAAHAAAQPAQPRQLFVKRGGEMGYVERCRLKPGELIFARMPSGEYETVGCVDSRGELPPPEVTP